MMHPVSVLTLVAAALAMPVAGAAQPSAASVPADKVVAQYCVGCHNNRNKGNVGGLTLESLDPLAPTANADVWEKVIKKVRGGLMPPAGAKRPEKSVLSGFADHLESSLDRHAGRNPDPGRTESFHRLNRTEYRNAIRDLLGLDIDVSDLLPPDAAGGGNASFDNIAAALRFSQSLLERYLSAGQKVSRAAVGLPPPPATRVYKVHADVRQDRHVAGMPLGTRGGVRAEHRFAVDAEYDFRVSVSGGGSDQLELAMDGEPVRLFEIAHVPTTNEGYVMRAGQKTLEVRLPVKAGPHVITATFSKRAASVLVESDRLPFLAGRGPLMGVESLAISGPFATNGPGTTPSRQRIFTCLPRTAAEEDSCAQSILSSLTRRAFRRPVTAADVAVPMKFYMEAKPTDGFEGGIQSGIHALLVSLPFLVRVETDPPAAPPNSVYAVSNLELASRLSFFLWSSIPDDELLRVATAGRLTNPAELERQALRMLADPRAESLTTNFASQWLYLRNLEYVTPVQELFPNFDETLRKSLFTETTMFVDSIRKEDRRVTDLLDADYTFVDERLAVHYGISGIKGTTFRRIALLPDSPRRGLLGKGSMLLVTSRPQRTSPVLRGKWILENIFGTPPPPPPPGVPPLGEQKQHDGNVLSVRALQARHRSNPLCSNCHLMIDPPGFALEGFDAVGRWRAVDESFQAIDASGVLPDGTKFGGLADFRAVLTNRPAQFATTMTEKLLMYAVGRGLEPADSPAIRGIVRAAGGQNYKFSALILGIVKSAPFTMRRAAAEVPAKVASK